MSANYEIHMYDRNGVHFSTRTFYDAGLARENFDFLKSMGYSCSLWHGGELMENSR